MTKEDLYQIKTLFDESFAENFDKSFKKAFKPAFDEALTESFPSAFRKEFSTAIASPEFSTVITEIVRPEFDALRSEIHEFKDEVLIREDQTIHELKEIRQEITFLGNRVTRLEHAQEHPSRIR